MVMELSMTTDYVEGIGLPEEPLRAIAKAGFKYIHWGHHWDTDFIYSVREINQIKTWLQQLDLKLLDVHASSGRNKTWGSSQEYERKSGVELVKNRILMAAHLNCKTVILQLPSLHGADKDQILLSVKRSLDELRPVCLNNDVQLALENLADDDFEFIKFLLNNYEPEFLGICYDSGHGNLSAEGLNQLESVKDRLFAVHLHDNDGTEDQHKLIFEGSVNWDRLAEIIALSSYSRCVSCESKIQQSSVSDETDFLARARLTSHKFSMMIHRKKKMIC